jgi:thioredoxin reductase (NADPH)
LGDDLDLVIVGGGPAGMTSGLYAARSRLKTKLLEKLSPGGQILTTDWVDNYPGFPEGLSGFELVDRMRQQAERFGLQIVSSEVTSLERDGEMIVVNTDDGRMTCRSLIIASGATPVKLGVTGELEMTGKGVSYCATCDGPFYRGVEVGVVGGGDTAVEEAIYLTRFASKVHLFHRRDELRAVKLLQEKAFAEPNLEIHWSTVLTEILANDQGMVRGAKWKNVKTGEQGEMALEGVFMFVGQTPVSEYARGFVDMDDVGFIQTNVEMLTSQEGVFAAGDVRCKKLRQIVTAVGDGATAAFAAEKYIDEKFGGPIGA